MSTPPATPPNPRGNTFSIVPHYHDLLTKDQSLTPPIAAIESLISLLSSSPITTVSETLSLISHASTELLKSQRNPIPVSAGTDLFQRYLITSFQNTPPASQSGSDFSHLRDQLIKNSKVFVARAKSARSKIARHARPLIRPDDSTVVVTYGSSRVVNSLLLHAASPTSTNGPTNSGGGGGGGRWFRVLQLLPSSSSSSPVSTRTRNQIQTLRKSGIEVATAPLAALSHALATLLQSQHQHHQQSKTNVIFVLGTSAVLENGAVVSEMGSALVAEVARAHALPLYVATESYKFARRFPLAYGERDLALMGTRQEVLRFETSPDREVGEGGGGGEVEQLVDITPPGLITGLITENGIMTPDAVAEELIKLWF